MMKPYTRLFAVLALVLPAVAGAQRVKPDTTLLREMVARNKAEADSTIKLTRSPKIKKWQVSIAARSDSILTLALKIAASVTVRVDTVRITTTVVRVDTVRVASTTPTPVPTPVPTPLPLPTPTPAPSTTPSPVVITAVDSLRLDVLGPSAVAELPRATPSNVVPPAARSVKVCPNACSLQSAVNAALPGDEILLAPGASYGTITLPNKAGASWITIRTDTTVVAPTRMTATAAATNRLARIVSSNGTPAVQTAPGAHHWRLQYVEIIGTADVGQLVVLGSSDMTQTDANRATKLILDSDYIHVLPTVNTRRCVALNSGETAIVNSTIVECHNGSEDAQAIFGWNGSGPFLIQNNRLEASHEVVGFGGGTYSVANGSPADATIRGNWITRPLTYRRVNGATVPGVSWPVKNLLETKHIKRLLVEFNVFENNWQDAQAGFCFVLKSENQDNDNPWTQSADITIRYNRIRNCGNGINLLAVSYPNPAVPMARVSIYQNTFESLNVEPYKADGIPLQVLGSLSDILIAHNTFANGPTTYSNQAISFEDQTARFTFSANLLYNGQYGLKGRDCQSGTACLAVYVPGAGFLNNTIVGADCGSMPATTLCPASWPTTLAKATDGLEVGANVARVNALTKDAVIP